MTELYSLPKMPGSYEIEPIHSYPVNSLITGADYNDELKLVALVGYDFNWNQYFYKISNFDLSNMDQSIIEKFKIPVGKAQIEAVKIIDESSFWITSEDEGNGFPRLFKFKIKAQVWSVTSFNLLRKDWMEIERYNQLNPSGKQKLTYVEACFSDSNVPVIAATDYMRSYAEQIRPYIHSSYTTLGTDGYGRSDSRQTLRDFFEVDSKSIARAAIYALYKNDKIDKNQIENYYKELGIDSNKPNPWEI